MDLIERLRDWASARYEVQLTEVSDMQSACAEAADEIERLTKERDALLHRSVPPVEAQPTTEFCWLLELFLPGGGNSLGLYHTGFTTLHNTSRTTKIPYEAKRYATREDAERAASKLESLRGVWHAVEHGFHCPAPVEAQVRAADEIERLTKERDALRLDAERYR